ncbi:RluA family pseudouridine synthase [Spirochaeta isovalerica]|uniref:tRNA pseudouridine32 synthase/23S rRNA pseudouridine746 synthase n=1 Tax=Spirochaeta isovalerica TaxID=150 RepID=A0A841RI09_9SPIO|nr:RluA family pseudouridine synthase [Spirochaeta isovalerica]MBB6482640.1 tRNA pseudouridine32 synthase/23S rRNA pseudouridine746 synthase [Spirochaeta isovalerica]
MKQFEPDCAPEVVYEDTWFYIVSKEREELTVPGRGPEKAHCLMSRAAEWLGEVYNIHRLDQPTSGLVILARTPEAQREMSRLFEARKVEKVYIARVRGKIEKDEGIIDLPLRGDRENRPRQIVDPERGKKAITRWRIKKEGERWTELFLYPETGRTHQLRVHLASIGHPIMGDRLYDDETDEMLMGELKLHASALAFKHPFTGEFLSVESKPDFDVDRKDQSR